MALSKLSEKCSKCPFVDKCNKKRMESVGFLPEPIISESISTTVSDLTQPILRETVNTIVDGTVVKVYKDDLEKEIYKSLYSHLGLNFGG